MRLVRLKLRACPFWNLLPIELNKANPLSPALDVDLLTDFQTDIINKSEAAGDIKLIGLDGSWIKGGIKAVNVIEGNYVNDDDVEEENDIPEIVSITVESESEETQDEQPVGPSEETFVEADILLNRNGNTVKKTVLVFDKTDQNLMLLHACLIKENEGKQRTGVMHVIQQVISEY